MESGGERMVHAFTPALRRAQDEGKGTAMPRLPPCSSAPLTRLHGPSHVQVKMKLSPFVILGPDPRIHAGRSKPATTVMEWIPGSSPGMTKAEGSRGSSP